MKRTTITPSITLAVRANMGDAVAPDETGNDATAPWAEN
jgi:hypothetical protein